MVEVIASQRLMYIMAKTDAEADVPELMELVTKIRELHKAGADLNYISEDDDLSLLGIAINKGLSLTFPVLAELNCDMDRAIQGKHPLLFAQQRRIDMVHHLAAQGSGKHLGENVIMALIDDVKTNVGEEEAREMVVSLFGEENLKDNTREHLLFDFNLLKNEQDREKNESRRHFIKLLAEKGPYRSYSKTPEIDPILDLIERFPNFEEVIRHVHRQVSLAALSPNSIMKFSPILLHGAPGLGKTRFVNELAKVMGMEFTKINCGTITAGWVISGSSTSWQEGRPGFVHTALRDGRTANPVIMLDEIDKLSGDTRFNAYGSLLSLLEDSTAKEFSDEAVNIAIDCSKVTWIATANELEMIPPAILSRMKLIEIHAPNKIQIRQTIKSIMQDIINEHIDSWGALFSPEISELVMDKLSDYSPRDIRNMIKDAMGEAAANRRCEKYDLEETDFISLRIRKRGIGFTG